MLYCVDEAITLFVWLRFLISMNCFWLLFVWTILEVWLTVCFKLRAWFQFLILEVFFIILSAKVFCGRDCIGDDDDDDDDDDPGVGVNDFNDSCFVDVSGVDDALSINVSSLCQKIMNKIYDCSIHKYHILNLQFLFFVNFNIFFYLLLKWTILTFLRYF